MADWDRDLVIDFDETICELRPVDSSYTLVAPKPGAKEALTNLRSKGWRIIVFTASGMGSYKGNVADIEKYRRPEIVEWLNNNEIPFDELIMGKPLGRYYIDDKAMKFTTWKEVEAQL